MNARIITIGDELLIGQVVDTNSSWISARLNEAGIKVTGRMTVADDACDIKYALDEALKVSGVVIVTGGLGPTRDDITKTTLADYFGCGMREDAQVYAMVEAMLAQRGVDFNALNRAQAMVPECCTVLPNRNGTAPGMWFERDGKVVVSLPGVPFEMKALMEEDVLPRLRNYFRMGEIVHRTMITQGLAESALAERIAPWEDALPAWLKLAYLPSPSGIRLRLSAYDDHAENGAPAEIDRRFARLEEIIGDYVIGYGDATVASAAAQLLTQTGKTLAVAESCTGGAIAGRFTAMAGASEYFLCGVVSYSSGSKTKILGVSASDIEKYGVVSRQVAERMAEGVRTLAGADYAIATTGVAGPSGGSEENPVGTVWIAVASWEGVFARRFMFGRLREQNIERASATAINMLRLLLSGRSGARITGGIL